MLVKDAVDEIAVAGVIVLGVGVVTGELATAKEAVDQNVEDVVVEIAFGEAVVEWVVDELTPFKGFVVGEAVFDGFAVEVTVVGGVILDGAVVEGFAVGGDVVDEISVELTVVRVVVLD